MNESIRFTLSFVDQHPENSAKILAQLPPRDIAEFLQTLPLDYALILLEKLPAFFSAQCLTHMTLEMATRLLEKSRHFTGVSILRLLPSLQTGNLLDGLSQKKRTRINRQLSWPQHLVGAWMDRESPTLPAHFSILEARKYLRSTHNPVDHSIAVLTSTGNVAGMAGLYPLAVSRGKSPLLKIVNPVTQPLKEQMPLETVSTLPDWENLDALPVTGPGGEYLGILTRTLLEKGMSMLHESPASSQVDSIVLQIVQGYVSAVSGLTQSAMAWTQPKNSNSPQDSKNG